MGGWTGLHKRMESHAVEINSSLLKGSKPEWNIHRIDVTVHHIVDQFSELCLVNSLNFLTKLNPLCPQEFNQEGRYKHFRRIEHWFLFWLQHKVLALGRGVFTTKNKIKIHLLMWDLRMGCREGSIQLKYSNDQPGEASSNWKRSHRHVQQRPQHPCIIKASLNLCPFIYMAVYNWLAVVLLVWHTFSRRRLLGSTGSEC